jgi:hypothetical protein
MGNALFFGNNSNSTIDGLKTTLNEVYVPVRVQSVVFDDTHPRFKELGGWSAIGTIEFSSFRDPFAQNTLTYQTARPFFPNIKQFPCQNEIVLLIQGVDSILAQTNVTDTSNYYVSILNLWNTPHQNALPNPFQQANPNLSQKDYQTTSAGSANVFTTEPETIPLGPGFVEQTDIHPSKAYPGDIIYEGRWGNSIRFGSTAQNPNTNAWSSTGAVGSPILILKNGQFASSEAPWIPLSDDINLDDSSIYFTSTQRIPIEVSSTNDYFSYKSNPPTNPGQYAGKQIILNSGRLVFNTTEDHLLLSSKKSINLNAVESINLDTTGNTILQSNKLYLGSKNATEPLLLGNATVTLLNSLLQALQQYVTITQTLVSTPAGTPLVPLNIASTNLLSVITALSQQLDFITSKDNFTV